jgi:hypothetical protein
MQPTSALDSDQHKLLGLFHRIFNPAFSGFDANNMTKLIKFHTLDSGDDQQRRAKISITNVKASTNEIDPYGSFNVEVRDLKDNDNSPDCIRKI